MWIRGIGALVTLIGSTLCADETGGQIERSATVCMLGGHPLVMEYARNLVSKMFAAIDVEIDWRWRLASGNRSLNNGQLGLLSSSSRFNGGDTGGPPVVQMTLRLLF